MIVKRFIRGIIFSLGWIAVLMASGEMTVNTFQEEIIIRTLLVGFFVICMLLVENMDTIWRKTMGLCRKCKRRWMKLDDFKITRKVVTYIYKCVCGHVAQVKGKI